MKYWLRWWLRSMLATTILLVGLAIRTPLASILDINQFALLLIALIACGLMMHLATVDLVYYSTLPLWRWSFFAVVGISLIITIILAKRWSPLYFMSSASWIGFLCWWGLMIWIKQYYHHYHGKPSLRWLSSYGSSQYVLGMTVCLAAFAVSLSTTLQLDCYTLNTYSDWFISKLSSPFARWWDLVSTTRQDLQKTLGFDTIGTNTELWFWWKLKAEYVNPLLDEQERINLKACETIFESIQKQIEQHQQTIGITVIVLLFLMIWPFATFLMWIISIISVLILYLMKHYRIITVRKEQVQAEFWE